MTVIYITYVMALDDARGLVLSLLASIAASEASDEDATFTERILDQRERWDALREATPCPST